MYVSDVGHRKRTRGHCQLAAARECSKCCNRMLLVSFEPSRLVFIRNLWTAVSLTRQPASQPPAVRFSMPQRSAHKLLPPPLPLPLISRTTLSEMKSCNIALIERHARTREGGGAVLQWSGESVKAHKPTQKSEQPHRACVEASRARARLSFSVRWCIKVFDVCRTGVCVCVCWVEPSSKYYEWL